MMVIHQSLGNHHLCKTWYIRTPNICVALLQKLKNKYKLEKYKKHNTDSHT